MTQKELDCSRQHRKVAQTILLACLLLFVWESRSVHPQIDDAYISYRYAQNLAEGNGLVYNIGERVEGFTNLLWTLMIAAGIALGGDAEVIGHWLGFISGSLLLMASYLYACTGGESLARRFGPLFRSFL